MISIIFLDSPTNLPDSEPLPWFSVDYLRLYDVLCQTVHTDQSTLLLYLLLHRNQHFKAHVISRTNIDQIVRNKIFSFFSILLINLLLPKGITNFTNNLHGYRKKFSSYLYVINHSINSIRG